MAIGSFKSARKNKTILRNVNMPEILTNDHDEGDYNERLRSSYDSTEGSSSSSSNMADHSHSNSSGIHSIVIAHELAELGLPS